jgi:hypothetical protein
VLPLGGEGAHDSAAPTSTPRQTCAHREPAVRGSPEKSALTSAAFFIGASSHAIAFAVIVLQACLGARGIRALGMDDELSTRERLLFGWAAGFALTTVAWMSLTALGALGPATVAAVVVAAAVVAWPDARRLGAKTVGILRSADSWTRLTVALGLVMLVFFAWPLWIQTLLPNSDWDSALYHLPLADRYRAGLLFAKDPYFPAFSFPGAVHLLYAALLSTGLECVIAPLNFQVTVLTGLATVALARHIGSRHAPVWTALAFATTPILWQLGLDPRVDGFLALEVVLAVYALVRFTQTGHDHYLVLTAVALGGAVGCKYTAWVFVLPIAGIGLGFRLWGARGARGLARLLGSCALALAVPNAAWYVANLVNHGDPFFPILRGDYVVDRDGHHRHLARADEAIDPALQADPDLRARLASLEANPTETPRHLFDFVDLLSNPERYAVRPNHGMGALLLLSLALPLALPRRPERRRGALLVWGLGWGSYALLGSSIPLLRYVAPSLPLLAAATGVLVARIPFRAARFAVVLAAVALLARDHLAELRKLEVLRVPEILGTASSPWSSPETRLAWLKQVGFNFTPPMAFVSDEISRRVARGEILQPCRILMVGEGKGRLQPCEFLPDASWFGHRFLAALENAGGDTDQLASALAAQGVTHILYNRAYYDWVATETDTHPTRIALLETQMDRLLERHGRLLFQAGGIRFYALVSEAS